MLYLTDLLQAQKQCKIVTNKKTTLLLHTFLKVQTRKRDRTRMEGTLPFQTTGLNQKQWQDLKNILYELDQGEIPDACKTKTSLNVTTLFATLSFSSQV